MTAIERILPEIYVTCPLGQGDALFLIDYGPNINSVWVVHLHESGKVVHVDSSEIRIMGNPMYGIADPEEPVKRSCT